MLQVFDAGTIVTYSTKWNRSVVKGYGVASLKEGFLAFCDAIFADSGKTCTPGQDGAHSSRDFVYPWGKRFAFVGAGGRVSFMGYTHWYFHQYDEKGHLISRKSVMELKKSGEEVVYGHEAVQKAYRLDPLKSMQRCGMGS